MSILVFIEVDNNKVKGSSIEAVTYGNKVAAQLGVPLQVAAMGSIDEGELESLGNYGATTVHHLSDERLDKGNITATSAFLAKAMSITDAELLIMPRSSLVDAVAPRVAIKTGASVASNVVALPDQTDGFVVKRGVYTGKAFSNVGLGDGKKIITIKKSAVSIEKSSNNKAEVKLLDITLGEDNFSVAQVSVEKAEGDILLPEADKVVSAGRGLKAPENWGMVEELAQTIQAATACSKPVSDMEWRPHHEHVGQTGIKISPNLYIAVGISGAIQHLAGVNSSKTIVVINKDAEAPFFKAADYGIVGDAFEILPKLNEAIKEAL